MIDLILIALWLVMVLLSPHPVVGLIGGPIVYCCVGFRMNIAIRQAHHQWWKATRS